MWVDISVPFLGEHLDLNYRFVDLERQKLMRVHGRDLLQESSVFEPVAKTRQLFVVLFRLGLQNKGRRRGYVLKRSDGNDGRQVAGRNDRCREFNAWSLAWICRKFQRKRARG